MVVTPLEGSAVRAFEDLPEAERLILGTESVPVGRYARAVIRSAGDMLGVDFAERVRSAVVSEEANTRLVRAKVELGVADAAIIYRTDAIASERVA